MATPISTIITIARRHIIESAAFFWTDDELVALTNRGVRDLWRAINDNYQNYFLTIDETNVSVAPHTSLLVGVPTDVSIVRGLEPKNLAGPQLIFRPKDYNHPDFINARARSAMDAGQNNVIWYAITGAGAPVGAPDIRIAPLLSTTVPLRLTYVPVFVELTAADPNPIPGESDNALIAWTVAYARAKEREDRSPDENWLAVYGTEKANILTSLTPRQTDEEDVVEAFFEPYWPY